MHSPFKVKQWRRLAALTLVTTVAAACGNDSVSGPTAARILLNVESLSLSQLDSAQLIPSFVDDEGTLLAGVPVTFTSSDPEIVSVSKIGVVTSLGPAGSATITVRGAKLSKQVPVTIRSVATKLVVTPNPAALAQKGTLQLVPQLLDRANSPVPNASFVYESSNPNIAAVSASGLVTSVGPSGTVNITIRSGDFALALPLAVTQVATSVRVLGQTPMRLAVGRSVRLSVVVLDAVDVVMHGPVLRYSSSNPSIISTASDGTITSVGPLGSAEIRVEVLNTQLSVTIQVTVVTTTSPTGAAVDSVSFDGGYAVALTATGRAILTGPFRNAAVSVDLETRASTPLSGGYVAYDVAITRDDRIAFMTTANNALREFNLATGTFSDIALGDGSYGLALSADGRFAYVGTSSNRLAVVELSTRTVVERIILPGRPLHISLDPTGRFAYVSGGEDVPVVEVDLSIRQVARTFSIPAPQATAVSADGRTLFVGSEGGAVYRVDLVAGTAGQFVAIPDCGVWGIGLTADERYLYLACSTAGRVDVLDIQSRAVVAKHRGFREPRRVAVSKDGAVVVVGTLHALAIFR